MPAAVDRCVKSILSENPGMTEERAWAICQAAYKKGLLSASAESIIISPIETNFEELCPECIHTLAQELIKVHQIPEAIAVKRAQDLLAKIFV